VAGRGLVTPRVCGRWLLVWLFIWLLDLATGYHYCLGHQPTVRDRDWALRQLSAAP
jgi:hypothetical protein